MAVSQPTGQESPPCSTASIREATDKFSELERDAYNSAFSELGLEWYWDVAHLSEALRTCAGDKHCIQAYIEGHQPHLLQAYDSGLSRRQPSQNVRRRLIEAVPHRVKHATLRQLKVFASVARPPELLARRRRAAPDAACRLGPDQEARGARRRPAVRAVRQEDLPHAGRRRTAAASAAGSSSSSRPPSTR